MPNGENRQYTVKDDYRFTVDGNKNATVFDLRKGMMSLGGKDCGRAQDGDRLQHRSELDKPLRRQLRDPLSRRRRRRLLLPREVAQARPAPAPATRSEPGSSAGRPSGAAKRQRELPHSGSKFPLVGVLGLLLIAAGLGLCRVGRSGNV